MKPKKKSVKQPQEKYIYLHDNHARWKAGINRAFIYRITGEKDRVLAKRQGDSIDGIIVLKENVFLTEEAAKAYVASKGELKWVVLARGLRGGHPQDLEVFQAYVKKHITIYGRYRNRGITTVAQRKGSDKVYDGYEVESFDTQREAVAYAVKCTKIAMKTVADYLKEYNSTSEKLQVLQKKLEATVYT